MAIVEKRKGVYEMDFKGEKLYALGFTPYGDYKSVLFVGTKSEIEKEAMELTEIDSKIMDFIDGFTVKSNDTKKYKLEWSLKVVEC